MAGGERVLHQIQYGLEGTHGDAVAADTRLLGEIVLPATDREVVIPGIGLGQRVTELLDAAFVRKVLAEGITYNTPEGVYYQVFPLLWSMLLKGNITPVEQTADQDDYLWTFEDALTGAETLDSATIECGDDARAYEIAYCLCPEMEITGNADTGEVSASANIFGDKITPTDFTGSIAMPTPTFVVGKLAQLYVDDSWAALGGSELEAALVDWRLRITGGAKPKLRGSSQRTIDAHGQGQISVELELGLERLAAVATEEDYYRAETVTPRYVRLEIDSGIQIGTGENHKLTFDIAGAWVSWQSFGRDADGNTLDVATLRAAYDITGTHAFTFSVLTDVAAI